METGTITKENAELCFKAGIEMSDKWIKSAVNDAKDNEQMNHLLYMLEVAALNILSNHLASRMISGEAGNGTEIVSQWGVDIIKLARVNVEDFKTQMKEEASAQA